MAELDSIKQNLLSQIADIHEVPAGAYSLRVDGKIFGKRSSENIEIVKLFAGTDIFNWFSCDRTD